MVQVRLCFAAGGRKRLLRKCIISAESERILKNFIERSGYWVYRGMTALSVR
jgi:hypothetical protein